MDPRRWARVEAVFLAALDRSEVTRGAYVEAECAGDADLREQVLGMLDQHTRDPDFLEQPVARVGGMTPEDTPDPSGGRIGAYRVVRRVGQGGMGDVFLAVQEGDGFSRSVAVKVMRPGSGSEERIRRFQVERSILAGLSHPNIASMLDGGVTDDGRPYLVMEFVDGIPIDRYCDERALDVGARLTLFRTVCEAVQYAHQNLVLHRDLKPANILVTADGVPTLLDFGVAKLVEPHADDPTPTRTAARMMTPEYAAPEQLSGAAVATATDVFSLGVLLYELLTGRRPHPPKSAAWDATERARLEDAAEAPSAAVVGGDAADERARARGSDPARLRRRLSGDLDTIVRAANRTEPERRYTSAAAISDDVRRHLDGLPVHARPDTVGYRMGKFVRRNALSLGAAAAVFVALAGATIFSVDQSRRVAAERDRALEVRGFLLEMFGATGPDQATGDSVTARALLDRQAETLDDLWPDRPVLRAEMMMVLAEGYDRLGLPAPADTLAASALALRRGELDEDHPDVAAALTLLGWVRYQAGDAAAAESLLREAVGLQEAGRADARVLSRALNDLGVVREAAGDYDEAESLYTRALEHRRAVFGPGHRAVAVTASNLSVIRYRQGRFAEAVAAATEALDAMRAAVGPDHQRSVVIQSNLAAFQVAMGDNAGAVGVYRDLLERQERIQGPDHPVTIRVLSSLSSVLANEAEWTEAESTVRRALAAQRAQLGTDHPQNGVLLVRLAQALNGQERFEEAAQAVDEGLALYRPALPPDHPVFAEAYETLADAVEATEPDRAETLHRGALAVLESRNGADHPATAIARTRLADRLKARGRYADAADLYGSAHAALVAAHDPDHPFVHRTRVRIAEVRRLLGDAAGADSVLAAAEAAFAAGGAEPHIVALADTLRGLLDAEAGRR
ncbi:MAG: serine/threonine-protein kinase [Longimicrobiales bacterium]